MKETTWNECLEKNSSRIITPDKQRAISLIETAFARLNVIGNITEKNCNFVFEDYYTSMLELLQAKSFIDGYNVLNHICLGFYLRDILNRNDLFLIFDDLRYKRNSLTYYGNRMDFEIANQSIKKCEKIVGELKKISKT